MLGRMKASDIEISELQQSRSALDPPMPLTVGEVAALVRITAEVERLANKRARKNYEKGLILPGNDVNILRAEKYHALGEKLQAWLNLSGAA